MKSIETLKMKKQVPSQRKKKLRILNFNESSFVKEGLPFKDILF